MNIPNTNVDNPEEEIPDQAKGNPVYEQTRQDMPLWCCGTNCGRNSRIVVFILVMVGIACSSYVCLSPQYFSFVSLRNDTFTDKDKFQPHPFEYATEANVGLFRYEILEVYEYPWPPKGERELFDAMHERELKRLDAVDGDGDVDNRKVTASTSTYMNRLLNRLLPNKFPDDFYDDDNVVTSIQTMDDDNVNGGGDDFFDDDNVVTSIQTMDDDNNKITAHQNDTTMLVLTRAPSDTPYEERIPTSFGILDVIPGSNAGVRLPTTSPTQSPTITNPNDLIDVDIGVVKPYPAGAKFDSLFSNGQMGAMWAPILATIGLIFSLIEFCCCVYKCSWLPTALCLYGAFMLQLMTMFLFMSEDFCKYDQDCALGFSGLLSAVAVMAYMVAQMLVCMTPRPQPIFDLCKKPPVKRKKKNRKKTPDEFDEKWGLVDDDDDDEDGFVDEPDGYVDPYNNGGGGDDDVYQEEPYDPNGYVDPYYNDGDGDDDDDDDDDYQEEPYDTSNNEYSDDYDDQEPYGEATDEGENNNGYDDYDYQETEDLDEGRSK